MCAQLIPGTLLYSFMNCYNTPGYPNKSFVCSWYNQSTCWCTDSHSCFRPDASSRQASTKNFPIVDDVYQTDTQLQKYSVIYDIYQNDI